MAGNFLGIRMGEGETRGVEIWAAAAAHRSIKCAEGKGGTPVPPQSNCQKEEKEHSGCSKQHVVSVFFFTCSFPPESCSTISWSFFSSSSSSSFPVPALSALSSSLLYTHRSEPGEGGRSGKNGIPPSLPSNHSKDEKAAEVRTRGKFPSRFLHRERRRRRRSWFLK